MACWQCGAENPAGSQYCRQCGASLAASVQPDVPAPPTAEDPHLYGGFWRRFAAMIIDYLVLAVGGAVIGLVAGGIGFGSTDREAVGLEVLMALVAWLYYALLESSSRQATLGKQALGLVVTDLAGRRIGFARATGRHFGKFLSGLVLLIGYLMAAFTARKQALHDKLAGTLVVRREALGTLVPAADQPMSRPLVGLLAVAGGIVVAGVIAAIALPAWQSRSARAQVDRGIEAARPYQERVAEALSLDVAPEDVTSESLQLEPVTDVTVLEGIEVTGGVVVLTFGGDADDSLVGAQLLLVPGLTPEGEVLWACGLAPAPDDAELVLPAHTQYTTVPEESLPDECRP